MKAQGILIYRLGSLGDTVIALPAFHLVRQAFPNAEITLLTNRPVAAKAAPSAAVLGEGYFFDDVMDYPVGTRDPRILIGLAREIRRRKIGTAINLAAFRSRFATWRDYFFFRAAGVHDFVGFSEAQGASLCPETQLIEWEAKSLARRLSVLGEIALEDDRWWDLRFSKEETADAIELLKPASKAKQMLALSIGTKLQANHWGHENWQDLTKRLGEKLHGWGLVLVGSPDERKLSDTYLQHWPGPAVNLCGLSTPRVSGAVLKHCRLFIGHDSGPMHLAACVGVPCVAVFSARNLPGQWFPRGRHNRILYHRTDCAGCRLELCVEQRKKCLTSISVSEVETAVLENLIARNLTT